MRSFRAEPTPSLKFKRSVVIKLSRLLDMWYKPSEIAEEIEVPTDTIYRTYLTAGCPHKRDESNLIWIRGTEFATWVHGINELSNKKAFTLAENQAWCVSCNQVVEISGGRERSMKRNLRIIQGRCAKCGAKVNRLKSGKEQG